MYKLYRRLETFNVIVVSHIKTNVGDKREWMDGGGVDDIFAVSTIISYFILNKLGTMSR